MAAHALVRMKCESPTQVSLRGTTLRMQNIPRWSAYSSREFQGYVTITVTSSYHMHYPCTNGNSFQVFTQVGDHFPSHLATGD